jgi:lambda repressor-like predicted transcriptional regulator
LWKIGEEPEVMSSVTMHPEAVKAAIRMRHGTLAAFAAHNRLEAQAVRDLLRGMSSTAKPFVAALLGVEPDQLSISRDSTDVEAHSKSLGAPHRLNAEAR